MFKFKKSIILLASVSLLSTSMVTNPAIVNAATSSNSLQILSTSSSQGQQSVFNIFSEVADIVGVSEQIIISKVESGLTLGAIAESYNISESTLLDQLEVRMTDDINQALKDGAITQTQATNMKNYVRAMLKILVENKYNNSSELLSAPAGITATSKDKTSITISWSSVSKATSYNVYRATSITGTYKRIATVKTTSYINKGLTKGSTYYYKVKAINSSGLSPYSWMVKGTVGSTVSSLAAPSGIAAKAASDSQISLSWNSVNKATSYYIYRSTSSNGSYSKIGTSATASYVDKSLSPKTSYYYKIQAVNSSSSSGYSSVATATTQASASDLDVPDDLKVTNVEEDAITLEWDSVDDATYYYIYRATSSSGAYSLIATVGNTEYTDDDLKENTTYYYKMKANNSNDTSDYSSVVYATTDKESDSDIDKPDDLEVTNVTEDEITLEWDEVDDADYYYVYRSKTSSGTYSKIDTAYDNEYTDYDVDEDTTYYYKVKACEDGNTSDYSASVHATTKDESDLDAPDDLEITNVTEDEMTLEWDEVDDAEYYLVYRSKSKSGTYSMVAKVYSNDYIDEDLNDDTTYYYKVRAYKDGKASDFSSVVYDTTDED